MKKHSLLLSFCSVLSVSLLFFVLFSCAEKQSQDEEMSEAEASEIISEEGSVDEAETAQKEGKSEADMSELESTVGKEDEQAAAEPTTETASAAPEQLPPVSDVPPVVEEPPQLTQNEPVVPTITEPVGELPKPPTEAAKWSGVSKAPKIRGKAIDSHGTKLNRFYFARKGDSSKSVAQLIYGDAGRAKDLKKWNPGNWPAGKVLYYASNIDPADPKMQSFYQENSIPFEEYTVGKKDTLSSIAKKKLKAFESWKEIAVLNGLETADEIEPGKKLEIYTKLRKAQVASHKAAAPANPVAEPPPAEAKPTEAVKQPEPDPNVGQPPPVAENPPPKQEREPAPRVDSEGMDIGNMITQNLLPIAVGGAVLVLLLLLLAVSKRKKKPVADDFSEDGFSAPPKLKKRK